MPTRGDFRALDSVLARSVAERPLGARLVLLELFTTVPPVARHPATATLVEIPAASARHGLEQRPRATIMFAPWLPSTTSETARKSFAAGSPC
jgi:hypothetical protein